MWKCPNCETVNNGEKCLICNLPKPIENNKPFNTNDNLNTNSNVGGTSTNNNLLISLFIVFIALFILVLCLVFGFFKAGNYLFNKNADNILVESTDLLEEDSAMDNTSDVVDGSKKLSYIHIENVATDSDDDSTESKNSNVDNNPNLSSSYYVYTNTRYGFYCAYPKEFYEIDVEGLNTLKSLVSYDGSAQMHIRACGNVDGIDINEALNEYYSYYVGNILYEAKGETWFAASVTIGDTMHYRKLFIGNGNIYCFDFSFIEDEEYYYAPFIEYIEDNFKLS